MVTRLSMMLLSLALAASLCLHHPSPVRLASRSRPALCLTTDPPATEAAVVNLALRSKVQPQIVKLVAAAESCQWMDPQQIDTLVGKIVDWCVDNCCDSLSKVWCEHLQHDLVNVASKGVRRSLRVALESYRPEVLPPKVTRVPPSRLPPLPPAHPAAPRPYCCPVHAQPGQKSIAVITTDGEGQQHRRAYVLMNKGDFDYLLTTTYRGGLTINSSGNDDDRNSGTDDDGNNSGGNDVGVETVLVAWDSVEGGGVYTYLEDGGVYARLNAEKFEEY